MVPEGPILFFDGVCNLCNRAVQFVIRHDRKGKVRFASLQSAAGLQARAAIRAQLGRVPDSLILLDGGKYYTESDAALRLAALLDGPWRALKGLMILPAFLRNALYRFIARHRYNWFGKRKECMVPTPELKARFLEEI